MFSKFSVFAIVALGLTLFAGNALAVKPAVIYGVGGKFDRSFNQAAYEGAEMFFKKFGDKYSDFEPTIESQCEQAMRYFALRGNDLIVLVGFSFGPALEKIAPEFPDIRFVIIDTIVDLPNVQSVVFKEHEGSFLVGMLAAMKSETGKIGFVGGMDVPFIRRFALGYTEGAQYVDTNVEIFRDMVGTTSAAWGDPVKAQMLARSQFDRGADVVFAAAGGSGMGVLQAAANRKKYAIGVDSNQNHIHPGFVLTSMVKGVDKAVFEAMRDARDGTWKPGVKRLGLAEGGVDYAIDQYNEALITPDMKSRVEAARKAIVSGKIKVTNYFEIMDK